MNPAHLFSYWYTPPGESINTLMKWYHEHVYLVLLSIVKIFGIFAPQTAEYNYCRATTAVHTRLLIPYIPEEVKNITYSVFAIVL